MAVQKVSLRTPLLDTIFHIAKGTLKFINPMIIFEEKGMVNV